MTAFPSITHVALTVNDLEVSVPWYRQLFDAEPIIDEDTGVFRQVVFRLGKTVVGLHQFSRGPTGERFSELRPGLDHLSFGCQSRGELERWQNRLDELGITHGGIVDAPYGSGLSFRDPDNIALELFAPPARSGGRSA
jgi:glyoxylase I family protein